MKDVAYEAGTSVGTVSNYLNGKRIRPELAKKISKAIKRLDYVRNDNARFLKTNKSKFIIFVVPTVWSPYFSELTFWIQKYLTDFDYKMILCISENDYEKEKEYVQLAEEQRAAGIISVSYSNLTSHIYSKIPLVSIEKESTGRFSLVTSDNYAGGALAAKEFNKRSVDEFYFVGSNSKDSVSMLARRAGFVDYCNDHGLNSKIFSLPSLQNKIKSENNLNKLWSSISADCKNKIGIFAYTDEIALYLIDFLKKKRISVPDEVQIIGFDGSFVTQNEHLDISSIRQPVKEIANAVVEQLNYEIKNPDTDIRRIVLPVSFDKRDTTIN